MRSIFSALVAGVMVTACGNSGDAPKPATETETGTDMTCPVNNPRNVNIWINAMPGMNDNPTLIAEFTVTAPAPGYSFTMGYANIRRTNAPVAKLRLLAHPPEAPTMQVETETQVRLEISNFYRADLEGVVIICGGEPFISLDEVETAY